MRRAWFCDGCNKEYTMEAWAKTCEGTHDPFIRASAGPELAEIKVSGEFVLFHPEHGDIVIQIDSLIESIDSNGVGPVWINRFHDDEIKTEAEASDE